MQAIDILILSNGPGEITTWVRPVVRALRQQFGEDRQQVRISLVLSPCPNASGQEVSIARQYAEIDRIQAAKDFFPFLLWGKTSENWDWHKRGVVLFLGGDQFFPVVIGRRLGYRTVIYGEWETRWHRWIDYFGVMKPDLIDRVSAQYAHKHRVVGDLMADVSLPSDSFPLPLSSTDTLIGLLPGSKPAKLSQGVPLGLAVAQQIHAARSQTNFVIPVAPTLDLDTLARFANPIHNPVLRKFGTSGASLIHDKGQSFLETAEGLRILLWTRSPAHDLLTRCQLCLTTVGANTAELGALAVPMIVLVPTQQLDAMRAWDGLPGLLANLPGVGSVFAKLINGWFLRKDRLLAWPNIWAGKEIVPEMIGELEPKQVAEFALDLLNQPEKRLQIQQQLRQVRGEPGAAQKLVQLVQEAIDLQP